MMAYISATRLLTSTDPSRCAIDDMKRVAEKQLSKDNVMDEDDEIEVRSASPDDKSYLLISFKGSHRRRI